MKFSIVLLFIAGLLFSRCSNDKTEYLPKATGRVGDVLLILDSVQWKGELGRQVRRVFQSEFPGLPQDEPLFNVIWIHPSKGLTMLKQMRNIVFVFTLDANTPGSRVMRQQFTEQTLDRIRSDTSFNMSTAENQFAKGQEVMYLVGRTEEDLIKYLQDKRRLITDYFNTAERERIATDILGTNSTQGITAFLRKEQNVELGVPVGYKLAEKADNFVWLRNMTAATDKDVFITWKPYESEYQLLPDSVIAWRNAICRQYLFEDPEKPESYLVTEQEDAKVIARQTQLNGNFAMEIRGLWRTNWRTMGGPFLGYAVVDAPSGRLYYIEGFAYAPGKDKREMMRELETILWTFKTIQQEEQAKGG